MFNLTPALDRRLRDFASERHLSIAAAIRYFIEQGLDGEERRASGSSQRLALARKIIGRRVK